MRTFLSSLFFISFYLVPSYVFPMKTTQQSQPKKATLLYRYRTEPEGWFFHHDKRHHHGKRGKRGFQGHRGLTGPQGPAGQTGPMGPQGPKGDTGPAGSQGASGIMQPILAFLCPAPLANGDSGSFYHSTLMYVVNYNMSYYAINANLLTIDITNLPANFTDPIVHATIERNYRSINFLTNLTGMIFVETHYANPGLAANQIRIFIVLSPSEVGIINGFHISITNPTTTLSPPLTYMKKKKKK